MTLFSPSRPSAPSPAPRRGERGTRKRVEPERKEPSRRERKNVEAGLKPRGFLLGDGTNVQNGKWYYDLDGKYVRVRGKKFIVERFGPERALRALTEEERALVMNARRNAAAAEKRRAGK